MMIILSCVCELAHLFILHMMIIMTSVVPEKYTDEIKIRKRGIFV